MYVQKEGFTDAIIDRFFKPFLGGIFFDKDLNVTSRLFEFVMRMLASGENSLPAHGIGAISEQLAAALPAGSIKTGQQSTIKHKTVCCACCAPAIRISKQ